MGSTDSGFNGPSGSTGNTDSTNLASTSNQVAATMTRMSPEVYKAAVEGKVDVLREKQKLEAELTPNKNTVLHIHISGGKAKKDCVLAILEKCPSLHLTQNIKGGTPLHMAAKEGLTEIVKALVDHQVNRPPHATDLESGVKATVKDMVGMQNEEGDTALHEAVRYNRLDLVKFLVGQNQFKYCSNNAGETPLYMAVIRGFDELVDEMLKTCNSPADYDGPNGRTALHQAIICSDAKGAWARKILAKMPNLATETDENGWTPLHYAACLNKVSQAEELLKKDKSVAYMVDKDGRIALHIAARRNHIEIMEKLISHCPDCSEQVDNKRCNVLHLAVQARSRKAVEHILKYSWASNLINEKDFEGNTPLHLFASSLTFMPTLIIGHLRVDRMAVNKNGLTPADILSSNSEAQLLKVFGQLVFKIFKITPAAQQNVTVPHVGDDHDVKEMASEIKKATKDSDDHRAKDKVSEIKKASKTHLIVAALIATVTYAAGFTLPGGYNGEKGPYRGMAILAKKATFIAFYITDGMAMFLSTVAVGIHFFMTLQEEQEQLSSSFKLASYSTLCAMVAMVAAFLMGTCAVLFSNSLPLAALLFFSSVNACLFYFFYPLLAKSVNIGKKIKASMQ